MKGKYVTKQVLLACYSKPLANKKSIHAQLEETIAERKQIMQQYELVLTEKPAASEKTIHAQLEETIAAVRKAMQQYGQLVYLEQRKNAA